MRKVTRHPNCQLAFGLAVQGARLQSVVVGATISAMAGLLEGVRVLDLTHYVAGPYCTRLMAGLGADVVKVERLPSGDPMRRMGPFTARPDVYRDYGNEPVEDGAWHLYLNMGKRSLGLDLKSEQGRQLALEMAAKADILVENFAPGTLDRLGLGFAELRRGQSGAGDYVNQQLRADRPLSRLAGHRGEPVRHGRADEHHRPSRNRNR